jgi:ribosomal-protein-alanine N-acetyltransferase
MTQSQVEAHSQPGAPNFPWRYEEGMFSFHNTNSVSVRPMREQDLQQVQAIDRLSFSMPWPESAYRFELRENPLSLLWVAEAALKSGLEQVVGVIVVWLVVDEVHIATLAVHPDFRGRGIAKLLLVAALKAAIQRGLQSATLEVRANNEVAQRLYQQFGFQIVGRRPRYYRDNNEDALIMTASRLGIEYLGWLESGAWERSDSESRKHPV